MTMKSVTIITVIITAAVALSGCEENKRNALWEQITQLDKEKLELKVRVDELEKNKETMDGQIKTLSKLGPEKRIEALSVIDNIKLSKRTGLFDKDEDGTKEKLIVFLKPIDETGDVVKAVGDVNIQLWDLNGDEEDALVKEWDIKPEELKRMWAGTFLTNYYRLEFDISGLIKESQEEITVKVKFTDYLSGKILSKQKVIKP